MQGLNARTLGWQQLVQSIFVFDIINIIDIFVCSSFLEMSCSSHLEMSHLDLGKLAGSPSDHGADDAPNSSG
ncbi:hypothetical protein, partial [Burkholderia sola]|uniref:hypothetical protein n=1 Tax=Burkholderia sola TaxID=2843302 RepID=UPI0023DD7195